MAVHGKPSLKHSALIATRRALRRSFKEEDGSHRVVDVVDLLTSSSSQLGPRAAVLLGVVAGVCARRPYLKPILESQKRHYISFFLREIIGSRNSVSQHLANALGDFFSEYITFQDLERDITPTVEKTLLRAPEVVLNDLISPMVQSLPSSIDLAPLLANNLAKPLIANLKSSNARIRDGAVSTFVTMIRRSKDEKYLAKVVDEILLPLSTSRLTAAEHRSLHSRILASLTNVPSRSESICQALAVVASKETNDAALSVELQALSCHLALLIKSRSQSNAKIFKTCADAVCKGFNDKKPPTRKAWVLMAGDFIWQTQNYHDNAEVQFFIGTAIPKMLEMFHEVMSNVLPSTQSGIVVIAFVLTALCTYLMNVVDDNKIKVSLRKASIYEQMYPSESKGVSPLSHRVYSKVTAEEDARWIIRGLVACSAQIPDTARNSAAAHAWAQAFIFLVTATSISHNIRREAATTLKECYLERPKDVAQRIIQGLWSWQEEVLAEQQDTAAIVSKSGNSRLHLAVQAICPSRDQTQSHASIDQSVLQDQLVGLVVLCREPLIPHVSWIEICLAAGQDPGDLVRSHHERCLAEIRSCGDSMQDGPAKLHVRAAVYNAAAELAFVAPETFTPILLKQVTDDLSAVDVRAYSPTDIAIARTSEGTTFIDVLSAKSQDQAVKKSAKDYDTLKWEAEVRSQLAAKKGQEARKLSADEKAKVDAQLKKEAVIRQKVLALEKRLRRGIGMVTALANGPPIDAGTWFGVCSKALLDIISVNVALVLGDAAELAYLDLAKLMSQRLGSLREFTGVATLRALGTSTLPKNMQQEPLGGRFGTSLYPLYRTDMHRTGHEGAVSLEIYGRATPVRHHLIDLHSTISHECVARKRHRPNGAR